MFLKPPKLDINTRYNFINLFKICLLFKVFFHLLRTPSIYKVDRWKLY
jgi:uncharacterized PurR-regulated membrane protein YhhQ (DUF165 family)